MLGLLVSSRNTSRTMMKWRGSLRPRLLGCALLSGIRIEPSDQFLAALLFLLHGLKDRLSAALRRGFCPGGVALPQCIQGVLKVLRGHHERPVLTRRWSPLFTGERLCDSNRGDKELVLLPIQDEPEICWRIAGAEVVPTKVRRNGGMSDKRQVCLVMKHAHGGALPSSKAASSPASVQ